MNRNIKAPGNQPNQPNLTTQPLYTDYRKTHVQEPQQPNNLKPYAEYQPNNYQRNENIITQREEVPQALILNPTVARPGPKLVAPKADVKPAPPVTVKAVPESVVKAAPEPVVKAALEPVVKAPEPIAKTSSLVSYHIAGRKGWQRVGGYIQGTDVQPIQAIKSGIIYGLSFSHSGLGSIPSGIIYICKNADISNTLSNIPLETDSSVLAIIRIKTEITDATNFTLLPNERTEKVIWESKSNVVNRGDQLSIYAEDLSSSNIELYLEYV